ncbi:hypothetical protein ACFLXQ_01130 [Chloroflexota bacterium]
MKVKGDTYQVTYDLEKAIVAFRGKVRLWRATDYEPIIQLLNEVAIAAPQKITLDLRELEFLNSSGIDILLRFVIKIRNQQSSQLVVWGGETIPWQEKSLSNMERLMPAGFQLDLV